MTPDQIRALRKRLGLNCAQFGALVGVSGRTVEDWEQGRRIPSQPAVLMMQHISDSIKSGEPRGRNLLDKAIDEASL